MPREFQEKGARNPTSCKERKSNFLVVHFKWSRPSFVEFILERYLHIKARVAVALLSHFAASTTLSKALTFSCMSFLMGWSIALFLDMFWVDFWSVIPSYLFLLLLLVLTCLLDDDFCEFYFGCEFLKSAFVFARCFMVTTSSLVCLRRNCFRPWKVQRPRIRLDCSIFFFIFKTPLQECSNALIAHSSFT